MALLAGVGLWAALSRGSQADPQGAAERTVSAFFEAQRDGDCERLLELVSESSWSAGGRRSREQFLRQCGEAPSGYAPAPDYGAVEIVDEEGREDADGGWAVVGPSVTGPRPGFRVDYGDDVRRERMCLGIELCGILVKEDDDWKVELDGALLRIGRSIEETIQGYLAAYADGDCGRLIGYLGESAWSADGRQDRDRFLVRCADAARAREPRPLALEVVDVLISGDDRAAAVVNLTRPRRPLVPPEHLAFENEDLVWRLHRNGRLAHIAPGTQLYALRHLELQERLVEEIQVRGTEPPGCPDQRVLADTLDTPFGVDGVGAIVGIRREFRWQNCDGTPLASESAAVSVYEFSDADEARAAVTRIATQDPGGGRSEPIRRSDVPGRPGALGLLSECDGRGLLDGCHRATVIAPHRHMVVEVELDHRAAGDVADAAGILTSQLDRL